MTRIAIVGGTGPEGRGLALRLAMAGHEVVIGSRDAGRAAEAAAGLLDAVVPAQAGTSSPSGRGASTPHSQERETSSTPLSQERETSSTPLSQEWETSSTPLSQEWETSSTPLSQEWETSSTPLSQEWERVRVRVDGAANADAVSDADVVLLAVPFEGLRPTAEALREALAGRLVVSIVAPVEFVEGQMRAVTVPEGSAGELTRDLLPQSRVAAAFQNMSSRDLLRAQHPLEGDVAVTADDESARRETMALAEAMPSLRAVDAGPLSNSRYVEELTALLVNLNRIHKAHSTIRFLGL